MIQYIIAAGIGAFLGSQSKKSKKSYAEGGGIGSRFELGTPVNYRTEDYSGNERIESGEVVLRNGKKAIKLYKDSNYSGDGERIRFFDEIDMSQVKNFSGSTYAHGGEVGKLKKYEKQLWRVMQVKGQSRKVKSDTSKEIHRVQEKIKNLQSSTYAEGGLLRVLKDSGFNHHKGSPKNELKHNRGAYIATIGKDNMGEVVHLDIYTPDTKTFISSTSFDNPKKLADYFNKNQLYAKGGKTRKKVKK